MTYPECLKLWVPMPISKTQNKTKTKSQPKAGSERWNSKHNFRVDLQQLESQTLPRPCCSRGAMESFPFLVISENLLGYGRLFFFPSTEIRWQKDCYIPSIFHLKEIVRYPIPCRFSGPFRDSEIGLAESGLFGSIWTTLSFQQDVMLI